MFPANAFRTLLNTNNFERTFVYIRENGPLYSKSHVIECEDIINISICKNCRFNTQIYT